MALIVDPGVGIMSEYITEQTERNVLTLKFDVASDWQQWIMLSSDHHVDNPMCRRDLLTRDLEKAQERDALIFFFGDTFCAMQGKYDKRSSMDDIRSEDVGEDYLDRIVNHAAELYSPFVANIALITKGNHETSIRKRHGTDIVSSLVTLLNINANGHRVYEGGYGGWVRFQFAVYTRKILRSLKYHHGAGGGGPVTRGVIQTNRQAVYLPDADIVVNGHTHDSWVVPIARERLNRKGHVARDLVHFVRTPAYKDEYRDDYGGFHTEKWGPPKPLGCVWLHFYYDRADGVRFELIPDVS